MDSSGPVNENALRQRAQPLAQKDLAALVHYEKSALFFDIDGTLIDIVKPPAQVEHRQEVSLLINQLYGKLKGALAIISGRPLATIKELFTIDCPLAGLHGGEIEEPQKSEISKATHYVNYRPAPQSAQELEQARQFLTEQSQLHDFLRLEDKAIILALHYNDADFPRASQQSEQQKTISQAIMHKALRFCAKDYQLQFGKDVIELKPKAFNKGKALDYFMQHPPFKGRRPIALGDDISDEAMFSAATRQKGTAIYIGPQKHKLAPYYIPSPSHLRAYLNNLLKQQ